jgi:Tfp pilus assembly protein PilE
MKTLIRHFKKVNGQSLAEFAVTTAMMATLATTAAPKFSGVGEGAKEKKTLADIDKILKSANNFYNEQVTKAGRGRFPGQWKYNEAVPSGGGYTYDEVNGGQDDAEYAVKLAVQGVIGSDGELETQPTFTGFDNTTDAPKWASCFGTNNPDALVPQVDQNTNAAISTAEDPSSQYFSDK